jgi:hypothetical protein
VPDATPGQPAARAIEATAMRDFAFYHVGFSGQRGLRALLVPFRRLIRRLLRPMLYRQAELLKGLQAQIDLLAIQARRQEIAAREGDAGLAREIEAVRDREPDPRLVERIERLEQLTGRLDQLERLTGRFDQLERRDEELASQLDATSAFGWDYVALVRRLASLEDHVEALQRPRDRDEAGGTRTIIPLRFTEADRAAGG